MNELARGYIRRANSRIPFIDPNDPASVRAALAYIEALLICALRADGDKS